MGDLGAPRDKDGDKERDGLIGSQVSVCRRKVGMSQETLAKRLGVKQQQVQKYEAGTNRISAAKIFAIADALGEPVDRFRRHFHEAATVLREHGPDYNPPRALYTKEGLLLLEAFSRISSKQARQALLDVARELSASVPKPEGPEQKDKATKE